MLPIETLQSRPVEYRPSLKCESVRSCKSHYRLSPGRYRKNPQYYMLMLRYTAPQCTQIRHIFLISPRSRKKPQDTSMSSNKIS